ncbi:MAG: ABC transporter substrate-binding protein [Treponema sp.]|jgi:peptide/nickel transport system substrate-binding protein|nr:ABC transporter substrate-binding protein [Treponema sp.]
MMNSKTRILLFLAVLVLLMSCFRQKAGGQSAGPLTSLRYGYNSEPTTFDPLNPSNTADGRSILFNVFEGLVKPDSGGALRPCIAESVTMEELGRVYNFKLRQGVRFHDGSPLTSADVKFSLDTAKSAGFIGFDAVEKIENNGDYSVKVVLSRPDPDFLPYLTVGIVKANSADRDKKAIGTGPYFIESYAVQRELVLRKFADYWQDKVPILDTITIVFFADSDASVRGLHAGSIDGVEVTGNLASQLSHEQFDIIPGYTAMVHLLALNNAAPPLDDIRVRQAINYGIDIQGIIDAAFFGNGEPSGSPLIPGLRAYYEHSLTNPYPVDLEKARSLLKEAGYGADVAGGDAGGGAIGENGKKLSLEITVASLYKMHVDTAQVIADQLARIGIDVSIRLVEWAAWLDDVYHRRKYQATIISLDSPIVSPKGFLSRYRSDDNSNFINYSSAAFDKVFDALLVEPDEDKRIALYKEAQRIISADAASVYIQDILGFRALRAGLYGGVLNYPLYVNDFAAMHPAAKSSEQ